jgi:hypothetical protein
MALATMTGTGRTEALMRTLITKVRIDFGGKNLAE